MDKKEIVTLDGPSGVGKSTISRKIAASLAYTYLDTGAMYRAVGLHLQAHDVDMANSDQVAENLKNVSIRLLPAEKEDDDTGVVLNGENVSKKIRTAAISMLASKVSSLPVVRDKLTKMQREIGSRGKIVAEGRDVGTIVFPDAAYKFFLDADIRERARRRVRQMNMEKAPEKEEQILEMMRKRDKDDSERTVAPLKMADDAFFIDTTNKTIEEVCSLILHNIKEKTP